MSNDLWYSMSDLPVGRLHVRVRRAGYRVEAVCDVDAKGRRHWHEVLIESRGLRPLPWPPAAWQPLAPEKWVWPAGERQPLPTLISPVFYSLESSFDAVAAAEEMEADREAARARPRGEEALEYSEDGGQWWRDVARVAYQPMGSVSRDMAEARIMRHLILERSMPLDLRRQKSNGAVLADLKRTLADLYGEEPEQDWVPPLVSQPEDHRDFDTVTRWLAESFTTPRELMVLRARMQAPPATWRQIGDSLGRRMTAEGARKIYVRAIDDLVLAANRPPTRSVRFITALRERNRRATR